MRDGDSFRKVQRLILDRVAGMGQGGSKGPSERVLAELPDHERYFGFENFGNTCYCNAVLQALYFCHPFRRLVLEQQHLVGSGKSSVLHIGSGGGGGGGGEESVLSNLAELFAQIASQKKKHGYLSPRKFVSRVKAESDLFSSYMHQDAHEFFNFLLNDMSDTLMKQEKKNRQMHVRLRDGQEKSFGSLSDRGGKGHPPAASRDLGVAGGLHTRTPSLQALHEAHQAREGSEDNEPIRTWVDDLFQGKLVSETQCMQCENVTTRQEAFYDLPLEIEPNCSVTACLRRFSSTETLDGGDKFSCDQCGCKQEAQRRMRVASLPPVLCLHLKRFKFIESLGQMKKLTHRVVFPFSLKLPNTTDECPDADVEYNLFAVVVHMGAHVNHGHYVALVKSGGRWLCFDDESVHGITEDQVRSTYGSTQEPVVRPGGQNIGHVDHAYILMYERGDDDARRTEGP